MKITNDEAFKLLDKCSAVIIDEHTVIFPSLVYSEEDEITHEIFLRLSYSLDDGEDYDLEYSVKDNKSVEVINKSTIRLTNTDGGETDLTLLKNMFILDSLNYD